jgi:hypothetical protein
MITPSFSLTATERVLPKLALDFTTASLDPRVTFTRTTSASNPATYVDSNGYITAATNNQPRFDYDPVTLVCKGLLIEESRTNTCLQSADQSVSPWAATRAGTATISTTQNYAVAPDNTQTATRVLMNLNGGEGSTANLCVLSQPIAVTSGTTYTASFYVKTNDNTTKTILVRDDSGAATFNTLKTVTGSYQRITVTGTAASTTNANFKIWLRGAVGTSFDADLSVWGWQWETGAFPTSYIPTTTTALTRNADVATMTGTNFSDWYNATEGTFVVRNNYNSGSNVGTAGGRVALAANTTVGNSLIVLYNRNGTANAALVLNTTAQAINDGIASTSNFIKTALAYKLNDFEMATNATQIFTDTSGTVPTVNRLNIGSTFNATSQLNGYIASVYYYPQRLTPNELLSFSK